MHSISHYPITLSHIRALRVTAKATPLVCALLVQDSLKFVQNTSEAAGLKCTYNSCSRKDNDDTAIIVGGVIGGLFGLCCFCCLCLMLVGLLEGKERGSLEKSPPARCSASTPSAPSSRKATSSRPQASRKPGKRTPGRTGRMPGRH